MKKKMRTIVLGCMLASGSVMGQATVWQGGAGDWSDGAKWNNGVPTLSLESHIYNNGGGEVATVYSNNAVSAKLVMENGAGLVITNGGNLNVGGQVMMGNALTSVGATITVDGGTFDQGTGASKEFYLGANEGGGILEVINSGTANLGHFAVGNTGHGLVSIDTGTVNVNGEWLIAGYQAGGTGDIVLSGGALNTSASTPLYVGFNGTGNLTNNGGAVTASGPVQLGANASGSGELVVDAGTFTAAGTFAVGQNGSGALTVNGGTVSANGPWLISGYLAGSTGDVTVNGGDLNVAGPLYVGFDGDGSLTVTGGVVDVTGHLNVAANVGSVGDVVINGGTVTASALNFGGAGTQTLDLNGGQLITTGGFAQSSSNSTFYIGSGELIFQASSLEDVQGAVSGPNWIYDDWPIITSNELGVVVTSGPKPPTEPAEIVGGGLTIVSSNVMRMAISTPMPAEYYYPESTLDLINGTWERIPHSDDGVNPFILTNLTYSTTDGTNFFIYLPYTNSTEFIRILGID